MNLSHVRRFFIPFVVLLFIPFISFANVTITAATGGTGTSADKSLGSPAAAYTTLGNIVLTSAVNTDFTSGSGLTIVLTAPANWQFLAGTGSVSVGGNISSASIVVTGTTATITYTCGAASTSNAITIIGLQVQATVKTTLASANIIRTGGTGTVAGFATNAIVGALSQVAGTFTKLQLLLPGETASAGSATGKTGAPTNPTAGTAITITVNSVDVNWNIVSSTDNIGITSTDANATLPANNTLSAGTRTFSITLKTAGSKTITASDITTPAKTANTSPAVTVAAGAFSKLQLLLPGETAAAGTATGKTGAPTNPTTGTAITVTVNSVDANWNVVSSTDNIGITSTDANAALPANNTLSAGTRTFSITLKTTGSRTITASDITNAGITANTSPAVTVGAGAFIKLQLLLPGETAAPGTVTGKTGTPTNPTAGTAITVTVNSVDANWNVVSSTDNIGITSTDANAALPANNTLSAGTRTFSITLKTVGSKTITGSDITNAGITANTSPIVTVAVGAFAKLQLLMPGETAAAGTATGKTGTPNTLFAGTAFNVTVNAVDANWNKVTTITQTVGITTNDPNAVVPANTALVAGTKTLAVTLKKVTATATVTATDITDGTKTANTSPSTTVVVGTFTKLQLLLPGETAAPGTATGKTGTPSARTAGTAFNVTVNAVDAAWNVVTTVTDVVAITSTDVNATLPANTALVAGTKSLSFTFKTSGIKTITASDITTPARTANASPTTTVNTGTFVKLQLLLPGETTAPGTATGKTGTPTARTAGTAFNVTVNAVDANWNRVTTVTDVVQITSTDALGTMPANAALAAGTKTNFSVRLKTPGTQTITATDVTNGARTPNTSPGVTVNAGAFSKLLIVLPGETYAAGTATGKTGTPTAPVAGNAFNVTVYAVDAVFNTITTATDAIQITSTDVNAVLPANASVVAGSKTFSITLKTGGAKTIKATDASNGLITAYTSPSVTVAAGAYSQLQILLPGETAAPGTATGATGTANPPARNTAFNITVNAVDAYFNKVTSITNTVIITSSDATAVLPAPAALTAGARVFSVNIKSVSTSPLPTITATQAAINKTVSVPVGIPPTVATDYFRSESSGNWNDANNWQSSTNGTTNWQDATLTPTSTASGINVRTGDVITVTANVTVDQVVVDADAQVIVNSGITLTIAAGAGGTQFTVSGMLTNAGTITTTGALAFLSGGKYQHNFTTTAGTIPTATWNTLSTCEVIGYTSYTGNMGGMNQTFGDFVWNCPGQNIAGNGISLNTTLTATMHSLSVVSTGTGQMRLATTGGTLTVTGDYNQSGGILVLNNTSGTLSLNIGGDFSISGGTLQQGTGLNSIAFNNTTQQTYEKTGGTLSGAVNFTVNANAKVDFGTSVIDGSTGTFTLSAGATLITGNDDGISSSGATGSIQTTTRVFDVAGNYTYNGNNAQAIGTGLPTTVNNLTIDNTQGVTMPATSVSYIINGTLSLLDGDLDMGTNDLLSGTLFANSSVVGTLSTQSISATPFTSGQIWNIPIEYYGASSQTIIPGTYSDLSFSGSGTKTAAAGTITIKGDWSSSDGLIDLLTNSASVVFNGTAQLLNDDGSDNGNGVVFKNVTFGNSGNKTLVTGSYSISNSGLLTMLGSAVLVANGNLTLVSDATGNGNIGPITGSADITGYVNIQSFITGGNIDLNRGTRAISTPINDAGLASKTYQQLQTYMLITGPGNVANGFDLGGTSTPNAVTLQTYNEPAYTTNIYTPVPNISQSATPGKGFFLFYRGDRSNPSSKLNTPFDAPGDVTVTYTGPINKGTVTMAGLTNTHNAGDPVNGYNLLGNPYPSTIDWETVLANSTNMDNLVVTIKPGGGSAQYFNGVGTNGGSRYIQTGQGFYVKVADASNTGSVSFTESSKVTNSPSRLLSLPANNKQALNAMPITAFLRMTLKDGKSSDETTVVFGDGFLETAKDDALYFLGGAVTLSTLSSDARSLAINFMPAVSKVTQLKLSVNATVSSKVTLLFTDISALGGAKVVLKDNFTGTITPVTQNTTYSFAIDKGNPATFGTARLVLMFGTPPPPVLPFQLVSFTAQKATTVANLAWTAKNETNNISFDVQRGTDSLSLTTISTVSSKRDTSLSSYIFTDSAPINGVNSYRLKQTNADGSYTYSNVLKLDFTVTAPVSLTVYPNPTTNTINISSNSIGNKLVNVAVYNTMGLAVLATRTPGTNGVITYDVGQLGQGVYFVNLTDATTAAFLGQVKFIKQ